MSLRAVRDPKRYGTCGFIVYVRENHQRVLSRVVTELDLSVY